ncbi:hypothetical protein Nmel_001652 [Mimus melanotis]
MQPTHDVQICPATQPVWKHLGHYETVELINVQGGNTGSDLFRELGPYLHDNRSVTSTWRTSKWYLHDNRSVTSTWRTSKWLTAHPQWQQICQPAQQTARRKQTCPEDGETMMDRLRKMRKQLEDEVYDEMFRAIISSLDNKESPMESSCILQDPSSPILEPAAGPLEPHSTSRATKDAAGETSKSLDQLLAELDPAPDDSLSCEALVKELLENWDEEELPDRKAAGDRNSKPQSALAHPQQDKEGCALGDGSSVTRELAAGSQGPHSTTAMTKDSAEAENNAEMTSPDLLAHLWAASGDLPTSDALLNELLQKWQEEELQDKAVAGLRDCEPESVLCLSLQEEEEETAPSHPDSDPCNEGHSESLPAALPEETKMSAVCPSSANTADKADIAWMQAGHAHAAPPQEKPHRPGAPAPWVPSQVPGSVPAGPTSSTAIRQPLAPRSWRSMAKTARRALRRLLSFSCLRGQPED